jgi:hypothetical protein
LQLGRTPIYFAIQNQSVQMLRFFLFYGADPWSQPASVSYEALCEGNKKIVIQLKRARQMSIILKLNVPKKRMEIWEREKMQFHEPYFPQRRSIQMGMMSQF